MIAHAGLRDSDRLTDIGDQDLYRSMGTKPYDDGYEFAAQFLDDLDDAQIDAVADAFVDIREICRQLDIDVISRRLVTDTIRGVALAGEGFGPTILVNETHVFNENETGRRFTIAHELCHILADRNRARTIGHASGAWALPSIEKRANAFAAYLLMPRELVLQAVGRFDVLGDEQVRNIAGELQVGFAALAHHLYNLSIIGEFERDRLLGALGHIR